MASLRQIEANRRNGSKGGPKTATGKLRSRANRLTHGLCAQTIQVMPDEDPEEWNRVRETIIGTSIVSDGVQLAVVEQLALNHWRSMRLRRHEIRLLNLQAGAQMEIAKRYPNGEVVEEDYEGGVAVALINSQEKEWTKFFRYDAAISRDFNRSVQQYVSLRKLPQPEREPAEIDTTPAEPLVAAASQACTNEAPVSAVSSQPPQAPEKVDTRRAQSEVGPITPTDSVSRLPTPDSSRKVSENGILDRAAPVRSVPSGPPIPSDLPTFRSSDLPSRSENGILDRVSPGGFVPSVTPAPPFSPLGCNGMIGSHREYEEAGRP